MFECVRVRDLSFALKPFFAYPKFVHLERVDALSQNQNQTDEEALYDKSLLEARVQELKAARDTGDFHKLLFVVRSDLLRNVGNKCNRWSPHHDLQQVSLLYFAMLCDEKHRPAHGMIWYDMIWYDMIWYDMIWYDMIWYDMIWYDMIWYDMIWYFMSVVLLYFLSGSLQLLTCTGYTVTCFSFCVSGILSVDAW